MTTAARTAAAPQVAAVLSAVQSDAFLQQLRAALATGDPRPPAEIAESLLDEMAVDRAGVRLRWEWDPSKRRLQVWARPAPARRSAKLAHVE